MNTNIHYISQKTYLFSPKNSMSHKILQNAVRTLQIEADAISALIPQINQTFIEIITLLFDCSGRVVVTGIGKSALIAQKIVATFNSTGTPAIFLHAADAIHGDIGMVQKGDVVLLLSKSGDTPEIRLLIPLIKRRGNKMVALVSNQQSTLAREADFVLFLPISEEACPNNLAPSASTAAQMAMGDALAFSVLEKRGFSSDDFALLHPGGVLGKQLYLQIADIYKNNGKPQVFSTDSIQQVIVEMTSNRLGATAVLVANSTQLCGIITDGDLRRMLESNQDFFALNAEDIMSLSPKTIEAQTLAIKALEKMKLHNITQLIVVEDGGYVGMVHLHDFLKEGLV